MKSLSVISTFLLGLIVHFSSSTASAQGTAFTYQGQLDAGGTPANGSYDLQFTLYTTNVTGTAIAGPVTNAAVRVTNGLFTTMVDFGNVFTGASNWLEIAVSTNGANTFTTLAPRQQLTPVPYAIYANSASNLLGNISALQITSGTIGVGQLPPAVVTNGATGLSLGVSNLSVSVNSQIAPLSVPPNIPGGPAGTSSGLNEPVSVAVSGRYAYVANLNGNSLQIVDVSNPSNPVSVDTLTGLNGPVSVAVAGRYAYVACENGNNLQIVDVSNPTDPVSVGTLTGLNQPCSVAVSGRYAYVANLNGNSLQIVDVGDAHGPVSVGILSGLIGPLSVAVAGRYAYVACGDGNNLQIVDVSNPTDPVSVGTLTGLYQPCSVAVSGRYAYVVNIDDNSLVIADVSNPSNPVSVDTLTGLNGPISIAVAGRYAYVGNIGDSMQIVDVSNPSSLASVGTFATGLNQHSVAVSGRYAYVVNSATDSLQVFDLGGAYIQQLEAGTMETGTLQTRDTATVGNNLDVRGGLTVSASARISGSLGVDSISAKNYSGNGSGLTSLNIANLSGTLQSANFPATTVTNFATAGPLAPATFSFTTHGGTLMITTDGSGSTNSAPASIGMVVSLDSTAITTNRVWANTSAIHIPFVSQTVVRPGVAAGSHTIKLSSWGATATDINDNFSVTVQELPY
ncbi:MAG TPA: hypothetical protein VMH87_19335 [Pseudomonadales bacterium]|nr:hypothetical protein [Pseudomonadales bacterium]